MVKYYIPFDYLSRWQWPLCISQFARKALKILAVTDETGAFWKAVFDDPIDAVLCERQHGPEILQNLAGGFSRRAPAVKADEEGENLLRRLAFLVDAPVPLVMVAFTGKAVAGLDRETKRSKA